jgi:2-succinyl-5-enolpyruvyl-6-hydroxy-3-cyclohexene-1-carboxylate synthase
MTAADTYLLLRAFVDELARCGMQQACTSPGSRCTPIVLTLAREPRIRCWSHIDERCAGFFALGAAKASGRPVAVTCTSGTAAANLAGAVIEAHEARVPLIVLSADRPPELREIGAGQTIDQLKLYGSAAKWFFEVGVQEASAERLRWIRALACRTYWTALQARPGVVHLNFPLREPLVLDDPLGEEPGGGGRPGGAPWVSFDRPAVGPATLVHPFGCSSRRDRFRRTVLVAGALSHDPAVGRELAAFAARARVPLLADPLSGARLGPAAIAHYDLLLRDREQAAALIPEVICRVGELPTSKPLRAWLAGLDVPQICFSADDAWSDPDSRLLARSVAPVRELLQRVALDEVIADASDWLERWRAADDRAGGAIATTLGEELSEPVLAARLGAWLPPDATLFVASSMPIRDLESYQPVLALPPRMLSNRGANGIDGTVSSAFGAAAVSDGPVVLLIGDVALAHDIGGLMAARRTGLPLTIVLVNNDGGGIFHFLPVAAEQDAFEQHVATPHGLDFAHAAALYRCEYELAGSVESVRAALQRSLGAGGTSIIELRTQRRQNLELHRRIAAAVLSELSPPGPASVPRA